jgi:hypothetical protein
MKREIDVIDNSDATEALGKTANFQHDSLDACLYEMFPKPTNRRSRSSASGIVHLSRNDTLNLIAEALGGRVRRDPTRLEDSNPKNVGKGTKGQPSPSLYGPKIKPHENNI